MGKVIKIRRVRTPKGVKHFKLPIGTPIGQAGKVNPRRPGLEEDGPTQRAYVQQNGHYDVASVGIIAPKVTPWNKYARRTADADDWIEAARMRLEFVWYNWEVDESHQAIVDAMRDGTEDQLPEALQDTLRGVKSWLAPIDQEVTLYKGIALPSGLNPGDELTDLAISSVTPKPIEALSFALARADLPLDKFKRDLMEIRGRDTKPQIMRIKFPKGTKLHHMNPDFETVVEPGTYRVVGAERRYAPMAIKDPNPEGDFFFELFGAQPWTESSRRIGIEILDVEFIPLSEDRSRED